ncbi:MAG: hypothetical protein N2512_09870 [Armatimonadetes bacterium]|nr:hypothetical protein [Armatimonadota bacterium]
MFLAWSAFWAVVAAVGLVVLQSLGLAPNELLWLAKRVLGVYAGGVALWYLLLLTVDAWTDGELRRIGALVADAVQYGLSPRIETSVLVVSLFSAVSAVLVGHFDPALIIFAAVSVVASGYAAVWPKRTLPPPRLPDLRPTPAPPVAPSPAPAPEPEVETVPAEPAPVPQHLKQKEFFWQYYSDPVWRHAFGIETKVTVDLSELEQKRSAERVGDVKRWGLEYVARGIGPTLASLAHALREVSRTRELTPLQEAALVLSFAQSAIEYATDAETTGAAEYPKYPVETVEDEIGDCEDKAILAAAAMRYMGYDATLLDLPGHVAVGLAFEPVGTPGALAIEHGGRVYYYCEATAQGAWIGEGPPDLAGPIEVIPTPEG